MLPALGRRRPNLPGGFYPKRSPFQCRDELCQRRPRPPGHRTKAPLLSTQVESSSKHNLRFGVTCTSGEVLSNPVLQFLFGKSWEGCVSVCAPERPIRSTDL